MNLLSVNYLHAGAPKYWYAIAEADAPRFESLAASHFNSAATSCKEFLRHKRYVISPPLLKKAGVSYTTQVQRPGDFIVTFPGSYHFGFNTGFNVAEATNFAVPEWTSLGFEAGICLCHPHSVRIDMERFLSLLRRCNIYRERYGYHLSYSDWAQMEAKRNLEIERVHNEKQTEKILSDASFENGKSSQANPVQLSETGTVVTIMTPSMLKKLRSNGSYNAGGVVETAANVQMRIALRAKPSQFLAKCKVLCIYACRDESSETAHDRRIIKKLFEGEITEIVEGHAKIRFLGKGRKNDAWLPLDGSALFLDEGYYQPDVTTPLGKE